MGPSISSVRLLSLSLSSALLTQAEPRVVLCDSYYGGDGDRVYLLGHGSGAHLALLTVVQQAITRSDPSLLPLPNLSNDEDQDLDIEGLILLSGIYDPVKHVRTEARAGWELISTLRRALGPSHAQTLLNSPAHLLYAAKQCLDPSQLPSKVLLIHGGLFSFLILAFSEIQRTKQQKLFG